MSREAGEGAEGNGGKGTGQRDLASGAARLRGMHIVAVLALDGAIAFDLSTPLEV